MTDIINDMNETASDNQRLCRIAYTLNNAQPVACTIIGDQPLFYMDYDGETDDAAMFDAADLGILEKELQNLKREIDSFDQFSEAFIADADQCLQDFLVDRAFITNAVQPSYNGESLTALLDTLGKSRSGAFYLDFARQHNVTIRHSTQVEDGFYDRAGQCILIHPQIDRPDQILIAARELRRHWQHRQGALIHPLMFQPDNAILVNRAQIADLAVAMVRIAWELQLTGEREVWERIENSSLADMGRAFAREAFLDFRTLNNGIASAAVFESWFFSERCRVEDKKLIKQMLADYKGYVFDLQQSGKGITPALLSALGSMPFGKNYLAQHAQTIMGDPVFSDVRDRSNANFLWFIKFERSFRESEQELQTFPGSQAAGVRPQASQQKAQEKTRKGSKDYTYVDAHALSQLHAAQEPAQASTGGATVIEFTQNSKSVDKQGKSGLSDHAALSAKRRKGKGRHAQPTAEIVYLRGWSGK